MALELTPNPFPHDAINTKRDSITVLVNKEHPLPKEYIPKDLVIPDILFDFNYYHEKKLLRQEAAAAIENLFQGAREKTLALYGISGFRSYQRQQEIYENNIHTKGFIITNQFSAKPGCSEHQTGLSMDISTSSINHRLEEAFAGTPEGRWLAKNAYHYGFIIRYPKDKLPFTGYSYEPWHIRYVGNPLASYLYENNLSLEEYYYHNN